MNVLAVIAHPDDEVLGAGATLRRLADEGHAIYTCVLCAEADARHARPELERFRAECERARAVIGIRDSLGFGFGNIRFNAVPHLEMVQAIEEALLRFRPEWVFAHHPGDLNIDHRVCYEATLAALRLPERLTSELPPTLVRRVLLFEVLSSTDWTTPLDPAFQPNCHFEVGATFAAKMEALACYSNAFKPDPHPRSRANIEAHARLRGAQVGVAMAEAFCIVRDLHALAEGER